MYRLGVIFLIIYALLASLLISYTGIYGWDDGAITLAYGKTLATAGQYALTASSEIVEGSSGNFLVLLTSVFCEIFSPDFTELITFSQYNSLFFTLATLLMVFLFLRRQNACSKNAALAITAGVGLLPMFFMEICNGMEMTMLSAFLLLFLWFYMQKSVWVFPVIIILLLIRFEAVFYLGVALFAQVIFNKNERPYAIKLLVFLVLSFIIYTAVRYLYFGDWLPNTIVAKMNPPYSEVSLEKALMAKMNGGLNFIKSYFFPLLLMVLVAISDFRKSISDVRFWLIVAFFIFTLVSGSEWGYRGRMTFAVYPIMVIFLADKLSQNQFLVKRLSLSQRTVLLFSVVFLTIFSNINVYGKLCNTIVHGGYCQGRYLPQHITADFLKETPNPKTTGVTPDNIRITGQAVDSLKTILNLNVIKLVTPDVGGVGLAFDKINVIDSGLLTNKTLAHKGYSYFGTYLEQCQPDVINTHDKWTEVSHIFSQDYFKNNFVAVIFDNNLLWLNKKYVTVISHHPKIDVNYISENHVSSDVRFFDASEIASYPRILDIRLKQK